MIRLDGDRMMVSGPLTLAHVAAALGEGNAAIGKGACSIDLGEVGELDSSALALLLAWLREHVHYHGRRKTAPEIVRNISGSDPSPEPYLSYLTDKYTALYE